MIALVFSVINFSASLMSIHHEKASISHKTGFAPERITALAHAAKVTLGIITSAVLRLFPYPKKKGMAIVAIQNVQKAIDFLKFISSSHKEQLNAFELNSNLGLKFIEKYYSSITIPFNNNYPRYVVFELSYLQTFLFEWRSKSKPCKTCNS